MITTILLFYEEMPLVHWVTYSTVVLTISFFLDKVVNSHSVHRIGIKFQCDYISRRALKEHRIWSKCTLALLLIGWHFMWLYRVMKILCMELYRICSLHVKVELANNQESLAKKQETKNRKLLFRWHAACPLLGYTSFPLIYLPVFSCLIH